MIFVEYVTNSKIANFHRERNAILFNGVICVLGSGLMVNGELLIWENNTSKAMYGSWFMINGSWSNSG